MRDLKFRAWDGNKMLYGITQWYVGETEKTNGKYFLIDDHPLEVLMQFTGLLDKNGKEIYEGDIIRVFEEDEWDDESAIKDFAVEWGGHYPAFQLAGYMELEYNSLQHAVSVASCEVIGNIYESPLLTQPINS